MPAYLLQTHEMLFDAHNHAFRVFGGIPRRGIYDNLWTPPGRDEHLAALGIGCVNLSGLLIEADLPLAMMGIRSFQCLLR